MRILIVDDSRAMQNIVRRGLEKAGCGSFETKLAGCGEEALDIARHWEPNLILSDWHMPGMSGLELLRALNREMLGIKLGLVTTETSQSRLAEAKAAGAHFIVNKPFDMDTLIQAVIPALQASTDSPASDNSNNINENSKDSNSIRLGDIDSLDKLINAATRKTVLLEPTPALSPDAINYPFVLGLMEDSSSGRIRAVCLLDTQAACILGGAVSGLDDDLIHQSIRSQSISPLLMSGCEKILQEICRSFTVCTTQTSANLTLSRANLVTKPFPRMVQLLNSSTSERSDLEVAVVGYGQGNMILVAS